MVGFSESPEFMAQTRSAVLVELLYQGLLQRSPESEGLAYWTSVADRGEPLGALIGALLSSDEYNGRFGRVIEHPPPSNRRSSEDRGLHLGIGFNQD